MGRRGLLVINGSRGRGPKAGQIVDSRRPRKLNSQALRMLAVLLVFILLAGLGVFRLLWIQVLKHGDYRRIAESLHTRRLVLPAKRGKILDCRLRTLAGSRETMSFWAYARGLTEDDKRTGSRQLMGFPGISKEVLDEAFGPRPRLVWLRRFCDEDTAVRLEELHVPGVGRTVEHRRYYTCDWVSNIVGFVNASGSAIEGVEHKFDKLLSGVPGTVVINPYVRLEGAPLTQGVLRPPVNGHNIVLTIDSDIQYILYSRLREACQLWNAPLALGVIMDPKTGAILGMATYPSYSSSHYRQSYTADNLKHIPAYLSNLRQPGGLYKARCLTDLFEPGSLFKVFAVAAALDMNKVRPHEAFFCENGSFKVGKSTISDWHPFGELTVEDILAKSSNIGMSKIGMRLGPRLLYEYLMRFGFLNKPGVGLFAEPTPQIKPLSQWDDEYTCFVSFGQGLSVSAVSLVSAVSAIANDGMLMQPYLVAAVQDSTGNIIYQTHPRVIRRVIRASTARTVVSMMRRVVTQGSGHRAAVDGISVCGKTGTAQVFDYQTGHYSHEDLITSFIGFAPAEDPQIALLISVFSPRHAQREIWGSTVAAPIFSAVAGHVLAYLESRKSPFLRMAKNKRLEAAES
ncbi:MAG: hypothetical protein DRH70_05460 [Candidatus Coatesbacteria bacterium]|nr:MAG: hypothetical protein DRH70_05460 [Candidatus Coatesbacteria bacterium]